MAEGSLTIRLAVRADAGSIHLGLQKIAKALHVGSKMTSTEHDISEHGFGSNPKFTALIAETSHGFAGMCIFFQSYSTWRGEPGAYIQDILVEENVRGLGIGEALLRATARYVCERMHGRFLRLSVDTENQGARRFYEDMGLSWSRSEAIHAAYGDDFAKLAQGVATP